MRTVALRTIMALGIIVDLSFYRRTYHNIHYIMYKQTQLLFKVSTSNNNAQIKIIYWESSMIVKQTQWLTIEQELQLLTLTKQI